MSESLAQVGYHGPALIVPRRANWFARLLRVLRRVRFRI